MDYTTMYMLLHLSLFLTMKITTEG